MPICEHCKLPEDRHASDCLIRLARKNRMLTGDERIIADLTKWRSDPDVKLIIHATCKRHGVDGLSGLAHEVIVDLHEAIATLMEESPTNTFPGDPRRMM